MGYAEAMRRAAKAGDPDPAMKFWRSKHWTDDERAAIRREARAWMAIGLEIEA